MKKIITACALILSSGGVFAEDDPFSNPDLGGVQYPVMMSEPIRGIEPELPDMGLSCDSNMDLYSDLLTYVGRDDLTVTVCPLQVINEGLSSIRAQLPSRLTQ